MLVVVPCQCSPPHPLLYPRVLPRIQLLAVSFNHVRVAKLLISKGANVNYVVKWATGKRARITPLYNACWLQSLHMATLLLEAGANPDTKVMFTLADGEVQKETALHPAVRKNNRALVKVLMDAGADCQLPCRNGLPALLLAYNNKASECSMVMMESLLPHDIMSQTNPEHLQALFERYIAHLLRGGAI